MISWKTLKHTIKNYELRKVDLDWSHGKSFLCSSGVQGCAQFVKERNPEFNWRFPFYTQKLCALKSSFVQYVLFSAPKRKQNRIVTLPFSLIYIYTIYHIYIVGPFALMGQLNQE